MTDDTSGERISSWVNDLGLRGCSLGMDNPPRAGSMVRLKIGTVRDFIEARGTVVHSRPHQAGVAFDELQPTSSVVLHKWLAAAKFPKGRA